MEYTVVNEDTAGRLSNEVNTLIRKGWEPTGGASVALDMLIGNHRIFTQAMIRR